MNVPMSWEPLEEPTKVRLLMQLDVLRSMVADAEPEWIQPVSATPSRFVEVWHGETGSAGDVG